MEEMGRGLNDRPEGFPALCQVFLQAITSTHTLTLMNLGWVWCKWGCRASPLCCVTHSMSTAVRELLVASPCRSPGPSLVGAGSCWVFQRFGRELRKPGLTCAGGN